MTQFGEKLPETRNEPARLNFSHYRRYRCALIP